jgi:hypothetical protein
MMTEPQVADSRRARSPAAGVRRRRFVVRTLSLAVPVVAVWLGLGLDPIVGPLVVGVLGSLAIGVGIVLGACMLGGIGFALFALGDRAVAWVRRVSSWPD